jgi:hypothetical protein
MTFKPMTYLLSFTAFVLLFMGLGAYVGYGRITDHFLAQAFLDAAPVDALGQADAQGVVLRWQGKATLPGGVSATFQASNRPQPIAIRYSDEPGSAAHDLPLAAHERTEDLRIDPAGRYLYARVFAPSDLKSLESTWLCKFDLRKRRLVRRTAVNPIILPPAYRP